MEISVFDQRGIEVKKYKKKDFDVHSAYDGISLVTDDKLLYLSTPAPEYPCTVEIKYEINTSGYIELPDWYMNTTVNSTQVFRYTVKVPAEMDIRYRSLNIGLEPKTETIGKNKTYTLGNEKYSGKKDRSRWI